MDIDSCDIILEYLEVFINNILYIRDLYPKQIFRKRRIYNAPVYISIYPPLNDYILKSLHTIRELKSTKDLHKVEIVIYSNLTEKIYETYVFEVNDEQQQQQQQQLKHCQIKNHISNDDPYLIRFEQELRKSLLMLENRVKILNKLPNDAVFKIQLHTTQMAFIKMSNNPELQDFPWVQENELTPDVRDKISILPVSKVQSTGIQLYVEKI